MPLFYLKKEKLLSVQYSSFSIKIISKFRAKLADVH